MSDQNETPEITQEMKRLLRDVQAHQFQPKDESFFSITGRGHLENPTSDLLGYFMRPNGQHGFGTCFLRAFFECMKVDWKTLNFDDVDVTPQAQTNDRKWIDLLVTGPDWVLVIENKIRAPLNNPLDSYKVHAGRYGMSRQPFFAVLAPSYISAPGWASIRYLEYCDALERLLPREVFTGWSSKWQVFAREFIVHLKNELYNPALTMTPEQIDFVEKNLQSIKTIKALSNGYASFLQGELGSRLRAVIPKRKFQFREGWALLCDEVATARVRIQIAFETPYHYCQDNPERKFRIGFMAYGLSDSETEIVRDTLGLRHVPHSGHCWYESPQRFDSDRRQDAVEYLCSLIMGLFTLLENENPVQTVQEVKNTVALNPIRDTNCPQ